MVYVGANDGMLHAFDASSTGGSEKWAYVPPLVMPDLYHLAENNYATNHRFYVDGPIGVGDAYDSTAKAWKTILISGLGRGGRGYFALDITDPTPGNVKVLWTFSADDSTNPNLGFSYGTPLLTKRADGTWVVVVASGYNNIPDQPKAGDFPHADGKGYVYVLDAFKGTVLKTISTDVGGVDTPAGLAYLNVRVTDQTTDSTAIAAYGGDLLGNLWRFDLDAGKATKVAALGSGQPITAEPEIGMVDSNLVLFFGTGRYLGQTDVKAILDGTIATQSLYGIKDDGKNTHVVTKTDLVQQTMTYGATSRTIASTASVNWSTKYGWYVNLDSKEVVYLPAQLDLGTIAFLSLIPSDDACSPSGKGFLYQLDYSTGGAPTSNTSVGTYLTSPGVGMTDFQLGDGTLKFLVQTGDGKAPTAVTATIGSSSGAAAGGARRVIWRTLGD
jgi:type IV pilus assembly protein PilY1